MKHTTLIRVTGRAYRSSKAQFEFSILDHIDAAVRLARPEDVLPLLELHKHHVLAQLQEEGLLKVTQHTAGKDKQRGEVCVGGGRCAWMQISGRRCASVQGFYIQKQVATNQPTGHF